MKEIELIEESCENYKFEWANTCHRYPPTAQPTSYGYDYISPEIKPHHWCGEWKCKFPVNPYHTLRPAEVSALSQAIREREAETGQTRTWKEIRKEVLTKLDPERNTTKHTEPFL